MRWNKCQKKIPKELLNLLQKRRDVAGKLMILDAKVDLMLESLNIADIDEYSEFQNNYGCMLYTEPNNYYDMTIDFLKNIKIREET